MANLKKSLEQKVFAFIKENKLITGGEKILAAVSGGPDSVCMLHILAGLRRELGIELQIAHLNHQLRGEESNMDAEYVKNLARRLKIPATIESRDVKAYQKTHGLTLEEAAREVRYSFLAEAARQSGAVKAAVGHTASDQAETVLMHLIRGSGIKGLRGLLPATELKTPGGNLKVVRPLLILSREETTVYCKEHNLKPRTDSTNLSIEPFRNKVRRRLLPELNKYNPQITEALLRTARNAADDYAFIEKEAREAYEKTARTEKGAVIIDKKRFLTLHPALQRQVLRSSLESLLGSLKDIETGHIENILEALEKPAGKIIGLPFGLDFYIDYDRYILTADISSLCPLPELDGEFTLKIPGKTVVPGWEIEASFLPGPVKTTGDGFTACFDAALAGNNLIVRHNLPGDRFQPLGMAELKKVGRFMIDARVPKAWRGRVPVVCSGKEILWLAGFRIDERYKVMPDTKQVLKLEFRLI